MGKVKEEFLDSARRGHEDEGGEGTFGGIRVAPEGLNFFSEHLFVMEFTFTFTSESEVRPCFLLFCVVCNSM